jgi:hypothetical protein
LDRVDEPRVGDAEKLDAGTIATSADDDKVSTSAEPSNPHADGKSATDLVEGISERQASRLDGSQPSDCLQSVLQVRLRVTRNRGSAAILPKDLARKAALRKCGGR